MDTNLTALEQTVQNDFIEFIISIEKCEDSYLPAFNNHKQTKRVEMHQISKENPPNGFMVFNDTIFFAKNKTHVDFVDTFNPFSEKWFFIINLMEKEDKRNIFKTSQINQVSQLQKQLIF